MDIQTTQNAIAAILERIPSVSVQRIEGGGRRISLGIALRDESGSRSYRLAVQVSSRGEPRMLRLACAELRSMLRPMDPRPHPVVVAPFISDAGFRICQEEDVSCIDLSGNCMLRIPGVFVEIRGRPNRFPASRQVKSLFSPRSSRIARVLLSDPGRMWQVRELAGEARVSMGLASSIRQRLLDEELVSGYGKKIKVISPSRLLSLWASHYSYRRSRIISCYALEGIPQTEAKISAYCRDRGVNCALGFFSGAARVAPHVRYGRAFAYVLGDLEAVARELGLKQVASGPNVMLMEPFDSGILFGTRDIDGFRVVSDIQLYLDLVRFEARGEEAAEYLLQEILEPKWTEQTRAAGQ